MNQSMIDILNNDTKLKEYIQSLEEELQMTEDVDGKINVVLDNILELYKDFTDRRSLKASNIEAITNMLKLKADLPMKRIQAKKMILDMLTKKQEIEIKLKTAQANGQIADSASSLLTAIFYKLDQNNVHPIIDENIVLSEDYKEIIDNPMKQLENSKEDNIKDISDYNSEVVDVAAIQRELDKEYDEEIGDE